MIIKLLYGNQWSEWRKHSRKKHLKLLGNPPDKVLVQVGDFYTKSPDKNKTEIVSFDVFNTIAREFMLKQQAQERQDNRHLHSEALDENEFYDEGDMLSEIIFEENKDTLYKAINSLTETQKRRLVLRYFKNKTLDEIKQIEGVRLFAVQKSIDVALKKIKKYF